MISEIKAAQYVKQGRVFPLRQDEKCEYWGVDGQHGIWEVRFDKEKLLYSCNCPNIRTTDCSHIKAVIIKRKKFYGDINDKGKVEKM